MGIHREVPMKVNVQWLQQFKEVTHGKSPGPTADTQIARPISEDG